MRTEVLTTVSFMNLLFAHKIITNIDKKSDRPKYADNCQIQTIAISYQQPSTNLNQIRIGTQQLIASQTIRFLLRTPNQLKNQQTLSRSRRRSL